MRTGWLIETAGAAAHHHLRYVANHMSYRRDGKQEYNKSRDWDEWFISIIARCHYK